MRVSVPLKTTDAFTSLSARYANAKGYRQRPLPGRADIYGAIIYCPHTQRYALVQGHQTGKWSFPKGHVHRYETPLECVVREVNEETGVDNLPAPQRGVSLDVGYYYYFEVPIEFELLPKDTNEVASVGWFTLDQIRTLSVNIDISAYLKQNTNTVMKR
jgi:8-oxo-dGTP pyrophosphatase MutT (NUDIX family)